MSDAVLKIGSVFDKQGIVDGMAEGVEGIQSGVATMSTSFQEIQGIAAAAMKKISEETLAAAGSVSDASVRVAEATRASSDAYAEQRNALKLVRAETTDQALATRILAASQEKARETALQLKAAQEDLARTRGVPATAAANQSLGELAGAASGLSASPQAHRLAAATVEDAAAQERLREVQQQVGLSTLSEEEKMAALSVAMERAKASSLELSTAQKEMGEAEEAAAVEAGLSANVFIASFQRMALAAKESMGQVRERVYEAAGSMRLSEGFSFGSLGGLGELLGIGIAVDMAGEFLDKTAEVNVELGHLAEKTGIAVDKLSGLQLITKEMGSDFDSVSTALVRMQNAQVLATQGHKEQAQGFADIGISVEELRALSPEELLQRIAAAFASHGNHAAQAAAAIEIFGRGGQALIPILREQGNALGENIDKAAKLTGVTEASVAASERWTRNMADLTSKFHAFGNILIENAHYVVGAFDGIGAVLQTIFEGIAAAIVSVARGIGGLGTLLVDGARGNFGALAEDARNVSAGFTDTWKSAFKDIGHAWDTVGDKFKKPVVETGKPASGGGDLPDTLPGGGKGHADEDRLRGFEQALNEEKLLHSVSVQEEYAFWESKLGAFKNGSAQYGEVLNRLATLAEEGARKFHEALQKMKEKPGQDSGKDAEFAKEFERSSAEMNAWLLKTDEDLTRTGERWQGYWRAVAQGERDAANAKAAMEEQALAARHSAGGLSDLAFAEAMQQIHARQAAAEMKILTDELAKLQEVAAKSPKEAVGGNLLDPKLAEQIKQLENQIAQLQARMQQQGFGDSAKIRNEIEKPFTDAFHAINQGWLKLQRDMILGTGNIKKDFVQMGANLVVSLAQSTEKMLAQWALYELRTLIGHEVTNQAKVLSDSIAAAESLSITQAFGLKEALIDAKSAAVKGWKAGMALPFPEDIVMAPVLAAVGFAGAMSQFNEGGVVMGGGGMHIPILAKQGERVLSTSQTNNFERLVNNSSSSSNSSRTNNVRVNQKQTFNGGKASSAAATQATIQRLHRNGKLKLA
jgi:hypothetical protein